MCGFKSVRRKTAAHIFTGTAHASARLTAFKYECFLILPSRMFFRERTSISRETAGSGREG